MKVKQPEWLSQVDHRISFDDVYSSHHIYVQLKSYLLPGATRGYQYLSGDLNQLAHAGFTVFLISVSGFTILSGKILPGEYAPTFTDSVTQKTSKEVTDFL